MSTKVSAPASRKPTQQQYLLERIERLAGLTRVWQIFEMIQKNHCLAERPEFRCRFRHRNPPLIEIGGLQQIQRFMPLSRSSSPDCAASPRASG